MPLCLNTVSLKKFVNIIRFLRQHPETAEYRNFRQELGSMGMKSPEEVVPTCTAADTGQAVTMDPAVVHSTAAAAKSTAAAAKYPKEEDVDEVDGRVTQLLGNKPLEMFLVFNVFSCIKTHLNKKYKKIKFQKEVNFWFIIVFRASWKIIFHESHFPRYRNNFRREQRPQIELFIMSGIEYTIHCFTNYIENMPLLSGFR